MITITNQIALPDTYPLKRLGLLEELLFFDIETTGFSGDCCQVYLIGCTCFLRGGWNLIQWFADTRDSEKEILTAFFTFLKDFTVLVHFNGDGFDIPFLLKRCQALGLPYDFSGLTSMDIYKRIRPLRKILGLDSLKQKSIERFLGIFRQDPYSGGQLIEVYEDYLNTREDALYQMLMLHNREDLEGMPLILPILYYPDFLEQEFVLKEEQLLSQPDLFGHMDYSLCLTLEGSDSLPVEIQWDTPLASLWACANRLEITIPLVQGTLKHFYANYKDYYYLIYEDTAVHKSVGEFVDREARKKATAQTCYTKKEGLFLPQPETLWTPVFKKDYRDKQLYVPYGPGLFAEEGVLMEYVRYVLGL